jgi:hypothetical protein
MYYREKCSYIPCLAVTCAVQGLSLALFLSGAGHLKRWVEGIGCEEVGRFMPHYRWVTWSIPGMRLNMRPYLACDFHLSAEFEG